MGTKTIVIESQYLLRYEHPENGITIGGTQRYAIELSRLFKNMGFNVVLLTKACKPVKFNYKGLADVIAFNVPYGTKGGIQFSKGVFDYCNEHKPLVACYSDLEVGFPYCYSNSFALQHGIAWDNPNGKLRTRILKKQYLLAIKKFKRVICVDTNFINWLREYDLDYFNNPDKCKYIPNFADEQYFKYKYHDWTSNSYPLLYARRLVAHRGYDIFTAMCKELMKDGYNITAVYAVESFADENKVRNVYAGFGKCEIVHPNMDDMSQQYENAFLSYIPTRWSEGSSLSAIESMCCGCPCIVSDVGGLGNIVLPDFNGTIVAPSVSAFVRASKTVIDDTSIRNRWSKNCEVTGSIFGVNRWRQQMTETLRDLL